MTLRLASALVVAFVLTGLLAGCCTAPLTSKPGGETTGQPQPSGTLPPSSIESITPPSTGDSTTPSTDDSPSARGLLPEDAVIPNVVGMPYEAGAEKLRLAGFLPVDRSIKSSGSDTLGKIYQQTPAAGQKRRRGSDVELRAYVIVPPP